jgi:topoisomerase-4 subunit B
MSKKRKQYSSALKSRVALAALKGEKTGEHRGRPTPGTGTTIRFTPDPQYFNTTKFERPALINALKSKTVLLSGLRVSYYDEELGREEVFYYD